MKNKIIVTGLLFFIVTGSVFAQKVTNFWTAEMIRIAEPMSNEDWIRIKPEIKLTATQFFTIQKQALGLDNDDELKVRKVEIDNLGITHTRYQQYYKGHKVNNGEYILHTDKSNNVLSGNGKLAFGLQNTVSINVSKEKALENALKAAPAIKYAWQEPVLELQIKEQFHDDTRTYLPKAEIVWMQKTEGAKVTYTLVYTYDIYYASLDAYRIFIDATNGNLLDKISLIYNCGQELWYTNFYSQQYFYASISAPNKRLYNDCNIARIHTRKYVYNSAAAEYTIPSYSGDWYDINSAITSHWGVEKVFNYFVNIHSRSSWNGANANTYVYQDAQFCSPPTPTCTNLANAAFGGGTMFVGNSGTTANLNDDWNSLDIIAHEFSHGVTESSANLVYSKESGALNESFSDIFGATTYAYTLGASSPNLWKVGYDRKNSLGWHIPIRDMANPNSYNHPDTYNGTYWTDVNDPNNSFDGWGVHSNSGVQNFMYYLLVVGGSGSNDFNTPYNVTGIGFTDARAIAYRALTVYLSANSNHLDARNAWVHAAADLFGSCTTQAIQTAKAWAAVGLGAPYPTLTYGVCGTYFGGPNFFYTKAEEILMPNNGCVSNIVPANINVQIISGTKVFLRPGFKALNGCYYNAKIFSDCAIAAYL
jgi:bacillolysin